VGLAQKILTFGNYIYQGFAAGTQPISELIMMLVAVSILVSYLKHYENEKN